MQIAKLRNHLALNTTILQLIDFGNAPVFTASVTTSIVILRKIPPQKSHIRILTWPPSTPVEEFETIFKAESFSLNQTELTADGWRLASPAVLRLVDKLRAAGKPLGEYVNGRFYRGVLTGLNEAFAVDSATRDRLIAEHPSSAEILKPFLRGRDVKRWSVDYTDTFLIKIESSANKKHPWSDKPPRDAEKIFAQTYPAIRAHFESFRNKLIARDDQGQYFWELRSCVYWQEFEQPKIIYPDIAQRTEFSFDTKNYYLANTLYLLPTNQQWLLGLLNSNTLFWFYNKISTQIRGGFVRFIAQYVSQIPIPDKTRHAKPIEGLVRQILELKAGDPAADVTGLEREIDDCVYKLYGLTREEIGIVKDAG